jgi:hypothetical protein
MYRVSTLLLLSLVAGCGRAPVQPPPNPSPQSTAKTPARQPTDHVLDSDRLAIGDTGTIVCAYAEIVEIIDEQSCVVLPYVDTPRQTGPRYVGLAELAEGMQEEAARPPLLRPHLPILLKGWPTAGKVTGQKDDLSGKVFRVTGTEDVKNPDGAVVRVHVLELVE